jgi:hypothetical protein
MLLCLTLLGSISVCIEFNPFYSLLHDIFQYQDFIDLDGKMGDELEMAQKEVMGA